MKVVIYARYRSSSQREVSIEQQIEVCKKYAEQNGYTIIKVYSDKAMTGKNDNRPQFQKLLSDCEKPLFDGVLVYSLNRFGRNMKQTLDNSYIIEKNGKCLLSATEPFDNTPSGKFMRNIFMAEAQFYSDELSEKILRGMNYNAERCLYNGGGVPLGYKIGKDKRFEIDPDTALIVQSIFKMYADGKTVTEINDLLNSKGYKTSKGVAFNKNSLHTILNNRRYLGYYIHCGHEIAGGIPQIISDELFEQVSDKLKKNKKAPARAKAKVEYLLTTKLFCGHCRITITYNSGDEPVTISDKLLSELEEKDEEDKFLFLNGSDPPFIEKTNTVIFFVGGLFGIVTTPRD